ncbi:MAG: ATP-binding protein [Bacteroidales bacterium]
MNIKTKLTLAIGLLVSMIILLVVLSIVNLQILTATDPDSPAAGPGLQRALLWISVIGILCIITGLVILLRMPASINEPIRELTKGIREIANQNYEKRLNLGKMQEFSDVADCFNRMAEKLSEYKASTLADILASRNYMEAIINSINEPIIGMNNEKEVLFINDEALTILNMTREKVIHKKALDISLTNDLFRKLIRELDAPLAEKKEPLKIYADNKESYFQANYIPISMMETGETEQVKVGHVILLKNITEFKELDSAKTTFISTISHELKTPISAILMSQQLLQNKQVGFLNPEQEELLQGIKDSSERLLSITGELLNMTQVEAGKLLLMPKITKPIELIEYAIKTNKVQADKFNIQIEVAYPEEKIGKLFVDSEKIAWVLTNLLSNAIRYSPENSRVIIGARQEGSYIEMFVQDFGKGIAPRYHKSIFDHYFRVPGTKVQGTGLGLSISKDFVEAHNGTLFVESELGKGSLFVIRLKV